MADLLVLCPITDVMRDRLTASFDLKQMIKGQDPDGWLTDNGSDVRYVLTDGHIGISGALLDRLPNVQIVSSYGVGYDGIDIPATTARQIPVCHTPNVLNQEVATTALMLYLACWRNLESEMANARSGNWVKHGALPLPRSADNRTIGILGLGRIGKAIAAKLAPFNPTILYYGRSKQDVPFKYFDDLTAMARVCDTLICVAPGDASTHHLINSEVLEAIGPQGFLINVGRGSTVDETAMIAALQAGTLGGAGLDVFENEPHIPDALRAIPNVVLTPHIGSATQETRRAMGDLAIDNLIAKKDGRDLVSPIPESAQIL
ncbi:2-hydroxyacid dehydrogenase [Octadecabacter sp. CECT 8868]|uniref:2-hydroxyacid dehydrogenase n=1 Tax=Octadecabacter algicola TaxID=2909342 RepID=UPI001F40B561|nr:2-hydroxyacid dehydrogenase [Octadecabacter algicola]MCF2903814.1 2-hydroxyacid dehydrogenase [Octadecabacter algicola]